VIQALCDEFYKLVFYEKQLTLTHKHYLAQVLR